MDQDHMWISPFGSTSQCRNGITYQRSNRKRVSLLFFGLYVVNVVSSALSFAGEHNEGKAGMSLSFRFLQKAKPPIGKEATPCLDTSFTSLKLLLLACSSTDIHHVYLRLPTTSMQVIKWCNLHYHRPSLNSLFVMMAAKYNSDKIFQ